MLTKWDKILISTIVIISLLAMVGISLSKNQEDLLYGIIEVNGIEEEVINLTQVDQAYTIKIGDNTHYNIIEVSPGSIGFIEATCPDQDCIRMGTLDRPGQMSVCLPNRVTIRVEGWGQDDDLDSTTY